MGCNVTGAIVILVRNWMGPNVQSGKTRWEQTSSLAKMAWDQMSMGPIVWLPPNITVFSLYRSSYQERVAEYGKYFQDGIK